MGAEAEDRRAGEGHAGHLDVMWLCRNCGWVGDDYLDHYELAHHISFDRLGLAAGSSSSVTLAFVPDDDD